MILRGGACARSSLGRSWKGGHPHWYRLQTGSTGVTRSHSRSWSYSKHSFWKSVDDDLMRRGYDSSISSYPDDSLYLGNESVVSRWYFGCCFQIPNSYSFELTAQLSVSDSQQLDSHWPPPSKSVCNQSPFNWVASCGNSWHLIQAMDPSLLIDAAGLEGFGHFQYDWAPTSLDFHLD